MKRLIFLSMMITTSVFSKIPESDALIRSQDDLVSLLSSDHKELVDPTCLKNKFLNHDRLRAIVVLGGKIESVNVYHIYNTSDSKKYIKIVANTSMGYAEYHCKLKNN